MDTTPMYILKETSDRKEWRRTMREVYEPLIIEKILFTNEDVVTTSPTNEYNGEEFPNGD